MEGECMTIAVSIQFFNPPSELEVVRAHVDEAASCLRSDLEVELQRVETLEEAECLPPAR